MRSYGTGVTRFKKKPSRMSLPKVALPRIYRIDAEIASGKYPNSKYLAKKYQTSVSTISRDIEFMKNTLGAPIEYNPYYRGYYYTEKLYRVPGGFSGVDDLLALGMAKSILTLYRETPLYEAANHLMESIIAPLSMAGNKNWLLEDRIAVPKIASAAVDPGVWHTIITSLKENRFITFEYLGTSDSEYKKRRVRPYQLLFDSGAWYLYGFSEERRATRIFSLQRIKNITLTRDKFALPLKYSYADYAGDSYFGVFIGEEKIHFVIHCFGEAAANAADRQWAADQKIREIENGVKFEFSSTQYNKVLKWVLSYGSCAVPVHPKRLRNDWKQEIREMARKAKN
jgi:predicted DNA-binding transcriptional regulator YafY